VRAHTDYLWFDTNREDPLPDGDPGEDRVDEIRRLLRHPPPAATGTDRAAFTRQRHEALERAVVAANPQEAMDEQPAPEEGTELALDEAGQPHPVGARSCCGQEGLQVLPDHSVQDRVGGSTWDVASHGARLSGCIGLTPPSRYCSAILRSLGAR
jgi:hypothetical protein